MLNTQTPETGGVTPESINLRIVDEQPTIGSNPFVAEIASTLPEFGKVGVANMTYNIVNNDSYLETIATQLMELSMNNAEFKSRYDNDEDGSLYSDDYNRLKNNIRRQTLRNSMTGGDIRETIINRDIQVRNFFVNEEVQSQEFNPSSLPLYYRNLGAQESGWQNVANRGVNGGSDSTAYGIFQFLDGTWEDIVSRYGEEYDLTQDGRNDLRQQLVANHLFTRDNARKLTQAGFEANDANLYMAHFLGPDGAVQFNEGLSEDPNQLATNLVSQRVALANRRVFFEDGDVDRPRTAQQVYDTQTQRFGTASTWETDITQFATRQEQRIPEERGNIPNYPITQFRDIIKSNPQNYTGFNLVDSNGRLNFDNNEEGNLLLTTAIENNEELQRQLFNDRYSLFENELSKSHNVTSMLSDPNEKIRAYSIYDRYGAEGLTQYMNYIEFYDPSRALRDQDRKVVDAIRFLNSTGRDGLTPVMWMQEFVGSEDSTFGQTEYTPLKKNLEINYELPEGVTPWSQDFYSFDGENFIKKNDTEIAKQLLDRYGVEYDLDNLETALTGEGELFTELKWQITRNENLNDLYSTLMAAGEYDNSLGSARYILRDYHNQPLDVRLAANALLNIDDQKDLFYRVDDATNEELRQAYSIERNLAGRVVSSLEDVQITSWDWAFEPKRLDRALESSGLGAITRYLTKTERGPVYDDNGNFLGMGDVPVSSFGNSLLSIGLSSIGFLDDFFGTHIRNAGIFLDTSVGLNTGAEVYYERFINPNRLAIDAWKQQFEPGSMTGLTGIGTDMALYLVALSRFGQYTTSGLGNTVRTIGNLRNVAAVERASAVAAPVRGMNKWQAYGQAIQNAARTKDRRVIGARMWMGDVFLTPMLPTEYSLIGSGALDMAAGYLGRETDFEQNYKRSGFFGRFFADAALNTVVGGFIDGLLSVVAASPRLLKGGNAFASNAWHRFEPVQMLDLVSEGVSEISVSTARTAARRGLTNLFRNPENFDTEALAVAVKEQSSPFVNNLKNDIRSIITHYDTAFTGAARKNIDSAVDKIYNDALEDAANNIVNFFKNSNEPNNAKMLSFADRLAEAATVIRQIDDYPPHIIPENGTVTFQQAQELKSVGRNRIVKNDGDRYVVMEVDSDEWATDLSSKIREIGNEDFIDDVINKAAKDVSPEQTDELVQEITEVFNTPITFKNADGADSKGFIIRLENEQAVVRDIDGNEFKATKEETTEALRVRFIEEFDNGTITDERFSELSNKYFKATIEEAEDVIREAASTPTKKKQPTLKELKEEQKAKQEAKKAEIKKEQGKKAVDSARKVRESDSTPPAPKERDEVTGLTSKVHNRIAAIIKKTPSLQEAKNFVKNLGVDGLDYFTAKYKKGKKRLMYLGSNVGPIQQYKQGTKIKKDIVVKIKELNGDDGYYITNKATELPPSRWIESSDGRVLPNPDWHPVNVNKTLNPSGGYVPYVKDANGLWRKARSGEEGQHFLNVQRPFTATDDIDDLSKLSQDEILANNYDAILVKKDGKDYIELVDNDLQAIANAKIVEENTMVSKSKPRKGRKPTEREATKKLVSEIKEVLDEGGETIKKIEEASPELKNISPYFVGLVGLSGSLLSGIIDSFNEENDYTYATLGLLTMFAFGAKGPKRLADIATNGATNISRVATAAKTANPAYYDNTIERGVKLSSNYSRSSEERAFGMVSPSSQTEETKAFREMFMKPLKNFITNAKGDASNLTEVIQNNQYTSSAWAFVGRLSKTGRQLRDILVPYDHEAKKMLAKFKTDFITSMGGDVNSYRNFITSTNSKVLNKLKELGVADATERTAYEEWNDALYRIINGSAKLVNGRVVIDPNKIPVVKMYEGSLGNLYQNLDRFLLEDSDFITYAQSYRRTMRSIKKEVFDISQAQLKEKLDLLGNSVIVNQRQIALLRSFVNTKLTAKQFAKRLPEEDQAAFNEVIKLSTQPGYELLKTVREIHKSRKAFSELGDSYVPQMYNRNKMQTIHNKLIANKIGEGMDKRQATEYADQEMFKQFLEVNRLNKKTDRLAKYDSESGQLVEQVFKSQKAALAELERIYQLNPELMGSQPNLRGFVKDIEITVDIDGDIKQNTRYIIDLPEEIQNVVQVSEYRKIYDDFMVGSVVKNSNFLERPRKWELPMQWAETDFDKILYRYSQDAGPRMHMTRNGIWGDADLNRMITKIRQELVEKGIDDDLIGKYTNRIKNIYNVQTGILRNVMQHTNPTDRLAELNKHMNFENLSSTVRNLNFAAYGWGISILDTFQPLVFSPLLSSWSSVKGAFKAITFNRQGLENLERLGEIYGLSMRKVEAFRPQNEFDFEHAAVLNQRGVKRAKAQQLSSMASDFVANASFTRGLVWGANKMTGNMFNIDVDNWGIAKLAFNNFYGVNSVSTTMNWFAGIIEAQGLSKIYKQLQLDNAPSMINGMTRDDVVRKFTQIGISEDRIAGFVRDSDNFDNMVKTLTADKPLNIDSLKQNPRLYNDLESIMQTMTDAYHGKNKMFRPETWSTPWGRIISQFSVYPFNFALQTTQRKIATPIKAFNKALNAGEYGNTKSIGNYEIPRVLYYMSTNNKKALYDMGFTDAAIQAFPVDSYTNIIKTITATNLAAASFITRDAVYDIIDFPFNDAAGEEQWQRVQRRSLVNAYAPSEAQFTWGDVVTGSGMSPTDYFTAIRGYAGYMADTGTFGLVGNLFFNPFAARDGITAYSISASRTSDIIKSINRITTGDLNKLPNTMSDEGIDFILGNAPLLGNFERTIKTGFDAMMNNAENSGVVVTDATTGEQINLQNLRMY